MSDSQKLRRVCVTGGGGYLGSVLVPLLLDAGYQVRVVDRFFFGRETLSSVEGRCEFVEADTRWCPEEVFANTYAVIDLAALSNDPAGELDPERTLDINFRARVRTATLSKKMGVERYILASSCSVYGFQDGMVDESAVPAPITTYAESSLRAEGGALALADDSFVVTALRQGTLYGLSPRMRFDLVVNIMTLSLYKDKIITVRGGEQWRPLLHVADSAAAFLRVLEAPKNVVGGEIFNVGMTEHNFKVADIAKQVLAAGESYGDIVSDKTSIDTRSYRVSSDKIHTVLGFVSRQTPQDGATEILNALRAGVVQDNIKTRTVDWYKQLLAKDPTVLDRVIESASIN